MDQKWISIELSWITKLALLRDHTLGLSFLSLFIVRHLGYSAHNQFFFFPLLPLLFSISYVQLIAENIGMQCPLWFRPSNWSNILLININTVEIIYKLLLYSSYHLISLLVRFLYFVSPLPSFSSSLLFHTLANKKMMLNWNAYDFSANSIDLLFINIWSLVITDCWCDERQSKGEWKIWALNSNFGQ